MVITLEGTAISHFKLQACSTTARRGALDWAPIFEKANLPVFEALYKSVKDGTETRKSLEFNGRKTYREDLAKELEEINNQEIWRAGEFNLVHIVVRLSANGPSIQGGLSELFALSTSHSRGIKIKRRLTFFICIYTLLRSNACFD